MTSLPMENVLKILLVDDHPDTLYFLKMRLSDEGFLVDVATDGKEANYMLSHNEYNLVILDVMLPDYSGHEVLIKARRQGCDTPVLFLSAKADLDDVTKGLDLGVDNYVTKPFKFEYLRSVVRAMVRRSTDVWDRYIQINKVTKIDTQTQIVIQGSDQYQLAKQEYIILVSLLLRRGKVVSRSKLSEKLREEDGDIQSNVLEVVIYNIRSKVGKSCIRTVRGRGYMIDILTA